jgi:hypothetical protein
VQAYPPYGQSHQASGTAYGSAYTYGAAETKTDGFAIAGFVCSFLIPLLGIIFSIIGLNRIKKNASLRGRGLAIAGIIISAVLMVLYVVLTIRQPQPA